MSAAFVDQAAEDLKYLWRTVDFVEDDQPVLVLPQKQGGIGKLPAVFWGFEIQIDGRHFLGNAPSQGCLSNLSRTDERHGGLSV
jgi:hypothetical protein